MLKSFVPVYDYMYTNKKYWKTILFPVIVALIALLLSFIFNVKNSVNLDELFTNFINSQISIIAILISFSIAIITILVSTDGETIKKLKETKSFSKNYRTIKHPGKEETLNLFQVLFSNVTYGALIQIIYLFVLLVESFVYTIIPSSAYKIITSINIFFVFHILYILYEVVTNIYFSFWNSPKESPIVTSADNNQ